MALIGGHPALWQLVLAEAGEQEIPLGELLGAPDLVSGVFALHLGRLRRWLERHGRLLEAVRAVLDDPAARLSFEDYCALFSKGVLVEVEPGLYRLRCPLYEDYFRMLWRRR